MNLHLVQFRGLLNHDVYLLLEGFLVIAAFILLQFIRPSLLANRVNYHEVYFIEALSVPPFADDILPLFLELPGKVSLQHQAQQLEQFFDQSKETMKLRAVIAEHILFQFRSRYIDLHCTTARERYDLLMQRCPGIVDHLDLQDIASFLNVHPNTISKIRRDITFEGQK